MENSILKVNFYCWITFWQVRGVSYAPGVLGLDRGEAILQMGGEAEYGLVSWPMPWLEQWHLHFLSEVGSRIIS